MKVIFYDRKNKREVSSEDLHSTKVIREIAVGDSNDDMVETGRRLCPITNEAFTLASFLDFIKTGKFKEWQQGREVKVEDWEHWKKEKTPCVLYLREQLISDLCYKSENCPSYCNWDLDTTLNDLVLLRLED